METGGNNQVNLNEFFSIKENDSHNHNKHHDEHNQNHNQKQPSKDKTKNTNVPLVWGTWMDKRKKNGKECSKDLVN